VIERLRQGLDKSKAVAKFKGMRRRQQIGIPAFAVILALSIWAALERDAFEGLLLLVGASALLMAALGFTPNRPKLRVASSSGENKAVAQREPVRPVDEEAIVDEQEQACREEMPRQPRAKFPPGHPLGGMEALTDQLEQAERLLNQPSDDSLREHLQEIRSYGYELGEWLSSYEDARAEYLRSFECELRVYEAGHASADHVDLILRFPEGFELDEDYPGVDEQPERPKFSSGAFLGPGMADLIRSGHQGIPTRPDGIKLHRTDDEPRYSLENGCPRIDYLLGHINQAHYRAVPAFTLKAPEDPGAYNVTWELSADGLPKALTGTVTLEFRPPPQGQPITALEDLEAEGRELHLLG
jgi:hypothetical protein